MIEFQLPVPPGYHESPVWTRNGFQIGSEHVSILCYTSCDDGWNSDLTEFHETEADQGNHYIDRASRLHACEELKQYLPPDGIILEIGSSSGYLLRDINKKFPRVFLMGSDCISQPLEKIAKYHSDFPLMQFDLVNCPLPDNCVDIIIALNVLEHIEDDRAALRQIHRVLKPGGCAIIEVPADPNLYDFYDKELKHFRRYTMDELSSKSGDAGFRVLNMSHLGFFIYPLFRFIKLRSAKKFERYEFEEKGSLKKMIHMGGPTMNCIIYFVMKMELYLGRIFSFPQGIRCLITLKKP